MNIVFASGKGGAGKTTVTASVASVWPRRAMLIDADVEAPNLALFVPTQDAHSVDEVKLEVPGAIKSRCDQCGDCVDLCQFKAIVKLGERIVTFPDMCHGCGGCFAVCERHAIERDSRLLGHVKSTAAFDGHVPFLEGRSRIGEAQTPPLIRNLLARGADYEVADRLIDAPPGVSCPVMSATKGADLVVLVAEPTPFGFYDFKLACVAFLEAGLNVAVVMNRVGLTGAETIEAELEAFCSEHQLPVLGRLPFEEAAAKHYARRELLANLSPEWRARFEAIAREILALGGQHA